MTAKKTKPAAASPARHDAIALLIDDHKKVKKLFKEFEKRAKADDIAGKMEVAQQICDELTIHTMIEEEVFYPAARQLLKDEDMFNEAEVEHASAKDLIAQIEEMDGDDPMYDATVKVLSEYIDHHVEEEEKEMFPQVRKTRLDLEAVCVQLMERKEELSEEVPA